MERKRRRKAFVTLRKEASSHLPQIPLENTIGGRLRRLLPVLQDIGWRLLHRSALPMIAAGVAGVVVLLFIANVFLSGNVPPNVYALGVSISGMKPDAAAAALTQAWQEDIRIAIMLNNEVMEYRQPEEIGLELDADSVVETAMGVGLSGIPFGVSVEPVIQFDYSAAQQYLLSQVEEVYIPPYEAGYAWENGQLVAVPGTSSRELDVTLTLENLAQDPGRVIEQRRVDLLTTSTAPNIVDSEPYLADARAFVDKNFRLVGYDPYADTLDVWGTTREELTRWLAAGPNGLTLRRGAFERFLYELNTRLREGEKPRYIHRDEAMQMMERAISSGSGQVELRVHYLPTSYEVVAGDTGFRISRKTGLPFIELQKVNPGLDWDSLYPGQTINLPQPDLMLQEEIVTNKRIVVDLESRWLVAYENDEIKFSWPVSIGRTDAPTYPGVFQILMQTEEAYGSGFSLCSSNTCGQWRMSWFMGIYEVTPGLMNGFHGGVLLPNGGWLGNGEQQGRTTYGCVMSNDEQAEMLYRWAEVGTVVEILGAEFSPTSELGQQALQHIREVAHQPAIVHNTQIGG